MDTQSGGFLPLVAKLQDGALEQDLNEQLSDIVSALTAQAREAGGKPKAKLTLSLVFKLDSGMVEVEANVTVAQPKPVMGKSIFWPTTDHQLSPENPRQHELPLRDVATEGVTPISAHQR